MKKSVVTVSSAVPAGAPSPPAIARITKRVDHETTDGKNILSAKLGGTYRVIHGRLEVTIPTEQRQNPDGSENVYLPKTDVALPGDEVWLNDADAYKALAMDVDQDRRHLHAVVEPLDSRPSRVNKVWSPPKATRMNIDAAMSRPSSF